MSTTNALLTNNKSISLRGKAPYFFFFVIALLITLYVVYSEYRQVKSFAVMCEKTGEVVVDAVNTSNSISKNDTIPKEAIKEFDVEKIWKEKQQHIFSRGHKENGISDVAKNERHLYDKMVDLVKRADKKGLLGESSTDIRTTINGVKMTVRVHIRDGKVMSLNGFTNNSGRVIYRLIEFE